MTNTFQATKAAALRRVIVTRWSYALGRLPRALATASFHGIRHVDILQGIAMLLKRVVAQVQLAQKTLSSPFLLYADPKMACVMWQKHAMAHPVPALTIPCAPQATSAAFLWAHAIKRMCAMVQPQIVRTQGYHRAPFVAVCLGCVMFPSIVLET
jgi:hypothetical protein